MILLCYTILMEERIFQKALSDMSFDFAARGAIRHLHELGYGAEEIRERLSYPLSLERIREELAVIEKEQREGTEKAEYERVTDAYGRSSFRRVVKKDISG